MQPNKIFLTILLAKFYLILFSGALIAEVNTSKFIEIASKGKTLQGFFVQRTTDEIGTIYKSITGSFSIKRPNKFIWQYYGKDADKIISTGNRVWFEQPDLQQVSHTALDNAMKSSPIAILLAPNNIAKFFTIIAQDDAEKLSWVQLIPHDAEDINFETLLVGFDQQTVKKIRIKDSFNRTVTISLIGVKYHLPLPDYLFYYQQRDFSSE